MSDWAVGDLLVCVDAGLRPLQHPSHAVALRQLREGQSYRLIGFTATTGIIIDGAVALNQYVGAGWRRDRFRKVLPDKHEACETEFVTLLKRSKQRVSA